MKSPTAPLCLAWDVARWVMLQSELPEELGRASSRCRGVCRREPGTHGVSTGVLAHVPTGKGLEMGRGSSP